MSERGKLKEGHYAWDHTKSGSRYVEKLIAEGDKLQRTIATGYCGECDIHKENLEAIRKIVYSSDTTLDRIKKIKRVLAE